jgi:general secretion pathway protein B
MSYILDALKKSEKERQKKNVPDLLTVQESVLHEKRKRTSWPYILIIVLIINMGFLGYLLGPKKQTKTKADNSGVQAQNELRLQEPQKTESAESEIPATAISVKENSQPKQAVKDKETIIPSGSIAQKKPVVQKAGDDRQMREQTVMQSVRPPVENETQNIQPRTTLENPGIAPAASVIPEQKAVQAETPPPVKDKIYHTSELPQAIQQSLPSVNVTIFMYSDDPASRMVRINGQTYREGQRISEDLTLERITQNGIILNYKNYRFQAGQQHSPLTHSPLTPLHQ